jgi:hypothetical protein
MAGGIFPGAPFKFNIKCVIFSLAIAGGYWYLPPKNFWVLFFLIWFPYIALAWYDYSYNCRDKLGPTVVPFGRYFWLPFKPQGYKDEFTKMAEQGGSPGGMVSAHRRPDCVSSQKALGRRGNVNGCRGLGSSQG